MFELTKEEKLEVVTNCDHLKSLKFSPNLPKVFSEKGLYMLATILKSNKATETTIAIIEVFTRACRHDILSHMAKHLICTAARKDFEFFAYLVATPLQSLILRNEFSTRCRSLYNSLSNDLCSFRLRLGGITTLISCLCAISIISSVS